MSTCKHVVSFPKIARFPRERSIPASPELFGATLNEIAFFIYDVDTSFLTPDKSGASCQAAMNLQVNLQNPSLDSSFFQGVFHCIRPFQSNIALEWKNDNKHLEYIYDYFFAVVFCSLLE